jgi:hypothetical protein
MWVCNSNNKKHSKSTVAIDGTKKNCTYEKNHNFGIGVDAKGTVRASWRNEGDHELYLS